MMKKKLFFLSLAMLSLGGGLKAQYAPNNDLDGDGVLNFRDLDSDNDGILDCVEKGLSSASMSSLFSLTGGAQFSGSNEIWLTPKNRYTAGAGWMKNKIDFAHPFTFRFQAYFGDQDIGADGIAVVFHNDPGGINTLGAFGLGLGAGNIRNGIALEMDTFRDTTNTEDPSSDHGMIWDTDHTQFNGRLLTLPTPGYGMTAPISFPLNLEDNRWHNVDVSWDPTTRKLTYSVDGYHAGTYTHSGTLDDFCNRFFGIPTSQKNKLVYFGFTGGTGRGENEHRVIMSEFCNLPVFVDPDGDGVPNHFDLDSDNDTCPDAREGTANIRAIDLNPNTSLAGGVDPSGIPTRVNGGQNPLGTYDRYINECDRDLDTDNDGILDCVEKGLSNARLQDLFSLAQTSGSIWGGSNNAWFIDNNTVRLTEDRRQQAGAIWSKNKINFAESFQLKASAYFGAKNNAADGIAMVFHNDQRGLATVGARGLGIGAGGIKNGIALEMDTFQNGGRTNRIGDINQDHGAIWYTDGAIFNGTRNDVIGVGANFILSSARNLGELDNGAWHEVIIIWDAPTKTLSYRVDGNLAGTYTHGGTLDNFCQTFFGIPASNQQKLVYFGYTASTGASFNEHRVRIADFCENYPVFVDSDGDGTPDYLDLDSDNDGCPDAIEGTGNIGYGDLNPDGSIAGAVDNDGVPVKANGGQGIGSSTNASVIAPECQSCQKLPNINAGIKVPTNHGITALGRAGGATINNSNDWPMVRQSSWSVLEAKAKGFVVNRVPFNASGNPEGIPTANFVEGMMVYDTTNHCLKLYNGTKWSCLSTLGCPKP